VFSRVSSIAPCTRRWSQSGSVSMCPSICSATLSCGRFAQLTPDEEVQQPDECPHFRLGPLPVLRAERIEGQVLHAVIGKALDHAPDVFRPGPVARDPGQAPLRRPAPVAVHDDGDVPRHPSARNRRNQVAQELRFRPLPRGAARCGLRLQGALLLSSCSLRRWWRCGRRSASAVLPRAV